MTTINDGGPAFPVPYEFMGAGLSLRQYAAIHLCVPDSGTDWLDDMIRERIRDELAADAMQALITSNDEGAGDRLDDIPEYAYHIADAMLPQRERDSDDQ